MNNPLKLGALAIALAAFSAGCATYTGQTNDPNDPNRTQRGALIGAAVGAAAGLLSGGEQQTWSEGDELGSLDARQRDIAVPLDTAGEVAFLIELAVVRQV